MIRRFTGYLSLFVSANFAAGTTYLISIGWDPKTIVLGVLLTGFYFWHAMYILREGSK